MKLAKIKIDTYNGFKMVQPTLANKKQIRSVYSLLKELIQAAQNGNTARTINDVLRVHTDIFKKIDGDTFDHYIERSVLIDLQANAHDLQTLKPDCSVKDFLNYVEALEKFEIETEQGSEFADHVQVSTIHQSKGKEFAHVFVINAGARQIPLDFKKKMFYVTSTTHKISRI